MKESGDAHAIIENTEAHLKMSINPWYLVASPVVVTQTRFEGYEVEWDGREQAQPDDGERGMNERLNGVTAHNICIIDLMNFNFVTCK